MIILDIRLGENVRVVDKTNRTTKRRIGKLYKVTKGLLIIDYGDFKESFMKADILVPKSYKLEVKRNKSWQPINYRRVL